MELLRCGVRASIDLVLEIDKLLNSAIIHDFRRDSIVHMNDAC
jgi:hypothetical protein